MPDSDIQRLVERIEGAGEGSREIDARIECVKQGWHFRKMLVSENNKNHVSFRTSDGDKGLYYTPQYAASIDAAMTLVPEGAGLSIQRYWIAAVEGPVWSAGISTGGIPSNPRQVFESYDAANAALAITAASLRARIT